MLSLNFFGAVATLEGLRPLLAASPAPRAVAVSSISSLGPTDPTLIEACLAMDENAARSAGQDAIAAGKDPLALYGSAKHALNRYCRTLAVQPQWAGAGIALNVVVPGVVDTPAAAYIIGNDDLRTQLGAMVPMQRAYPARSRANGRADRVVRGCREFPDDRPGAVRRRRIRVSRPRGESMVKTELPATASPPGAFSRATMFRTIGLSLLVNGVCPYLLYTALEPHYSEGAFQPLLYASIFPLIGLVFGVVRNRMVDMIAAIVLFGMAINIAAIFLTH